MESYSKDAPNKVAERIRIKRREKGFSQELLAQAVGCSVTTVSNWEKSREYGGTLPDTDMLFKVCDVLECDLDFLTGKIEAHTNNAEDVMKLTGLTEKAVNLLISYNQLASVNDINETKRFQTLIEEQQGEYPIKTKELNTNYRDLLSTISSIIETDIALNIDQYRSADELNKHNLTKPFGIKPGDIFSRIILDRLKILLDQLKK